MQGKYDKAIADFDLMIRLNPRTRSISMVAEACTSLSRTPIAIADFDQAIALEPTMASAWRYRGLAWATKREFDHACATWTKLYD